MPELARVAPEIGTLLVSRLVAEQKMKVRFLYREEPDHETDSGWRVFSGDEDQSFADDPDNLGLYDADTVARIDPDVVPLLLEPAPCAFERESAEVPFVRVDDFGFAPDE